MLDLHNLDSVTVVPVLTNFRQLLSPTPEHIVMYGLALILSVLLISTRANFGDSARGTADSSLFDHVDVRPSESKGITLGDIVNAVNANPLSLVEKKNTIKIAILLFEQYNPNIFIYRRFLDEQPVDDLKKLDRSVHKLTNFQFYSEMRRIFSKANDGHTRFLAPEPLRSAQATLGFQITLYYESAHNEVKFVVTDILDDQPVQSDAIKPGVEIVEVDGVPIQKAIAAIGKRTDLSNENTQFRGGARKIFNRALVVDPSPSRTHAVIGYIDESKTRQYVTLPWMFEMDESDPEKSASPEEEETDQCAEGDGVASSQDEIVKMDAIRRIRMKATASERKLEMALRYTGPKNNLADRYRQQKRRREDVKQAKSMKPSTQVPVPECLQDFFSAKTVDTASGTFGYLGISTFLSPVSDATFNSLFEVVDNFPTNGLIVDIRGNPGGFVVNAKLLTDFLTNATTNSMPTVLRASSLTRKMANSRNLSEYAELEVKEWKAAVETGLELGSKMTGPVGDILWPFIGIHARLLPQAYFGPVVVVTDALSFSTADVYAALQRDTGAAWVVGVDDSTGGAGASTIPYSLLHEGFPDVFRESLPKGAVMTTASRQAFRTGPKSGALIENIGVEPDERYFITRRDALFDDVDLFEHLGKILLRRR